MRYHIWIIYKSSSTKAQMSKLVKTALDTDETFSSYKRKQVNNQLVYRGKELGEHFWQQIMWFGPVM